MPTMYYFSSMKCRFAHTRRLRISVATPSKYGWWTLSSDERVCKACYCTKSNKLSGDLFVSSCHTCLPRNMSMSIQLHGWVLRIISLSILFRGLILPSICVKKWKWLIIILGDYFGSYQCLTVTWVFVRHTLQLRLMGVAPAERWPLAHKKIINGVQCLIVSRGNFKYSRVFHLSSRAVKASLHDCNGGDAEVLDILTIVCDFLKDLEEINARWMCIDSSTWELWDWKLKRETHCGDWSDLVGLRLLPCSRSEYEMIDQLSFTSISDQELHDVVVSI